MPLALAGLLVSFAIWEPFKYCSDRWSFDHHQFYSQAIDQYRTMRLGSIIMLLLLVLFAFVVTSLETKHSRMNLNSANLVYRLLQRPRFLLTFLNVQIALFSLLLRLVIQVTLTKTIA
ncbi:unnamed protein product [Cochlearia groenlandica]